MEDQHFEPDIVCCLDVLRKGGIILYPTDTIWGLGCDATNDAAVERIFELKRRPANKSMIVLVADESAVLRYVAAPPPDLSARIPSDAKPTTVIYDGALGLAPGVTDHKGAVAIRIVKERFCYSLLRRFGRPIVSTSANFSGSPAPRTFAEIDPELAALADYVVHYRQNDIQPAEPSAVIAFDPQGEIVVIRP